VKILVTGSSGLIGRQLVARLRARGDTVVPFDLRPAQGDAVCDIRDRDSLDAAIAGCEGVFHLAAVSRVAWGEDDPATCHEINVTATRHLVNAALAAAEPWIVFASSREVYGDPGTTPVRESDPIAPINAYGRSKADAEKVIADARKAGLGTATLRLSNVYGTINDHPDRAVPALMWRALQGQLIRLTGGTNFFDFVHIDDCIDGVIAAAAKLANAEKALPTVHLATGAPTSLVELAEAARDICRSLSPIEIVPARSFDVLGFCGEPSFAEQILGWRARISLQDGMRRLLAEMQKTTTGIAPVAHPGAAIGSIETP